MYIASTANVSLQLIVLTCWRIPQEYLPEHKVNNDSRIIHTFPCGLPQQLHVSLQVVPKELWKVFGTDVYFDKLDQPLHSTLEDYNVVQFIGYTLCKPFQLQENQFLSMHDIMSSHSLLYLIVAAGPEEGRVH